MCLMLLNDLSRPRSIVVLMRRVLVGQNQIKMDLGVRSKEELEKMSTLLSLLKSLAAEEGQENGY